jgi:hypothetical protein
MDPIAQLLEIASAPLCDAPGEVTGLPAPVAALLARRNGFYAFEAALHVFPSRTVPQEFGVEAWNDPHMWRDAYPDLDPGAWFFGEDAFGCQFAFVDGGVHTFDPETGAFEALADTVEAWAAMVLSDFAVLTGQPLAHAWQAAYRPLAPGERLMPKVPFVLGGAFALDNLYAANTVESLRYRGDIAGQIRSLPDGTRIRLRILE